MTKRIFNGSLTVSVSGEKSSSHSLQCYACGLPKVHPEFDVIGSYGKKIYNHSCDELRNTMKEGVVDDRFVRTCPDGVKSCFGATGFYDHRDTDPTNDISKLLLKILGSLFGWVREFTFMENSR